MMNSSIPVKTQKNILIFGSTFPENTGPSLFYRSLLNSHFKEKFKVEFIEFTFNTSLNSFEKMRPKKFLLIVKFLYQEIRVLLKNRIDYVFIPVSTNLNAVLKELIFISIALIFSKKVILIQHGNNFQKIRDTAPSIYDHIIHPILKRAHSGVVLAKNLKDNFRDILSEGKIVSIYPGIPTFRKYIEPIQDKRNNFRILFLSNLIPQKGYFDLIRAIPDVLQIYPGTMFIFAGEWKDDKVQTKEIVLKFIEDHQLNEVIIFAGKVDLPAKVDLYSDADIYVFPTHFDSFGLVLLEAMQFGLPIITTNVGAIPEIIIDGVNGIIVEKGHPERIAEEIIKLLKDPMLRQEMKKTNLAAFEAKFTTEKFSDRMVDFFDSLS